LTTRWSNIKPYSDVVTEGYTRDIGNVLLTFTMFWAYFSLSQWLIIYSGNLPEETTYYLNRGLKSEDRPDSVLVACIRYSVWTVLYPVSLPLVRQDQAVAFAPG